MPRDTTVGWEVDESGISVTSPLGEICDMSGGLDETTFTLEEMEAHAHLIAAAPELLLGLKVMVDQVADDPRACQFFDLDWLEDVKAVIKKAEGRV